MVFSSTFFLCYFLPLLLAVYFLSPVRYRNFILLVSGIFFYAWGAPKFIFVILGTTLLDFFLVKAMDKSSDEKRRKLFLLISISVNLGLLAWFKYAGFFVENINHALHLFGMKGTINWTKLVLPIGISFYTFETMTYVVDVYRRVHKPLKNFWDYQLYIILFPKLIAGPIVRYHEIADQITDRAANYNAEEKLMGFYRFCIGLAKKVLIANSLAYYVDGVYGNTDYNIPGLAPELVSTSTIWFTSLAYTFQIYFDFSGYSDMAIGLGRILGFRFPENFNNPYISESITEFWKRWHMTLGNWMRNYLYIPLGGNKVTPRRLYFNLWIVFILSGLWHGAAWNFIIWGVWHGGIMVAERLFLLKITSRIGRIPRIVFTFFLVNLGWILFRVEHLRDIKDYLKSFFGFGHGQLTAEINGQVFWTFIIALCFSFFCIPKKGLQLQHFVYEGRMKDLQHGFIACMAVMVFVISLSYVTSAGYSPFIYFRF